MGLKIGKAAASIDTSREKLTVGLRGCELKTWFGICDLVMMAFISVGLLFLERQQHAEEERIVDHGRKSTS